MIYLILHRKFSLEMSSAAAQLQKRILSFWFKGLYFKDKTLNVIEELFLVEVGFFFL